MVQRLAMLDKDYTKEKDIWFKFKVLCSKIILSVKMIMLATPTLQVKILTKVLNQISSSTVWLAVVTVKNRCLVRV